MILVGNQRGGARDLARHLLKDENERVVLHDMRGFAANDLLGAFQESHAISRGTKCKQHLFSLSLNPPKDADASPEDFEDAVARVEKSLGLTNQPRAIVFHEKKGADGQTRRHAHAVWCRIDIENMKAVQLSFSHSKLQDVARELYRDHGWQMPRGFVRHEERDPRNFSLSEWQQCKRAERDPAKTKEIFQDAWAVSDSRAALAQALRAHGFVLARGDRRGAIAVDYRGEAYSVSRYVGIKAKQVRDRLGDLSALPDAATAQNEAAQDVQKRLDELRREEERHKAEEAARQKEEQSCLRARQVREAAQLHQAQQKREREAQIARNAKIRTGWRGLIDRITGQRRKTLEDNARAQEQALQRDEQERRAAAARQVQQLAQTQSRAQATQQKRANTIKELRDDFNALEASKKAERQRAKEAFIRDRKNRTTRPKRRNRARDGPNLER
ncbi:MAG: relaxase/mobilization nuclease domain-containing protein [Alphaproteobacteria bacterium]